jgi:hypothetical protein
VRKATQPPNRPVPRVSEAPPAPETRSSEMSSQTQNAAAYTGSALNLQARLEIVDCALRAAGVPCRLRPPLAAQNYQPHWRRQTLKEQV